MFRPSSRYGKCQCKHHPTPEPPKQCQELEGEVCVNGNHAVCGEGGECMGWGWIKILFLFLLITPGFNLHITRVYWKKYYTGVKNYSMVAFFRPPSKAGCL